MATKNMLSLGGAVLLLQIATILTAPEAISASVLKDSCRLQEVKSQDGKAESGYFMTKDTLDALEEDEILKDLSRVTKAACLKECRAECKAIAMTASLETRDLYNGCYSFSEDLEHLIDQKKILPSSQMSEDDDSVLTLFNVVCDDENRIGGGDGGNGAEAISSSTSSRVMTLAGTLMAARRLW